jgi:hypothetical protein
LRLDLLNAATEFGLLQAAYVSYNWVMSTTEILEHVLDPFVDCLTPEAARKIIALRADADAQERLDQLADRANDGTLTPDEQAEYEKYRAIFHLITLLQSKARLLLNGQRAS